jgi:hypothetical protein
MPFELSVQISGFGPAFTTLPNGNRSEQFTTSDIIRAAVVAGYEPGGSGIDWRVRAWRIAATRLALQLQPLPSLPGLIQPLSHPRVWRRLDPSEKASVNNLLGNTITKLLCERLLDAPRLWFLDVYGNLFPASLIGVRRPDFFTRTLAGAWVSVEAKGRSNGPSIAGLNSAKSQAQALQAVNGSTTVAHVVCWTMARAGSVFARFHDPEPTNGDPNVASLTVELDRLVRDYYVPVHEIMEASQPVEHAQSLMLYRFEAGDFEIGIHPKVQELLPFHNSEIASKLLHLGADALEPISNIIAGPDGVIVIPGRSWGDG